MKRPIEDVMKIEYKKYRETCKKPKSFFDWASDVRTKTLKSLKEELKVWSEYEPKKFAIIKVKSIKGK